jgi:hypothetical protein
MNDWPTHASSNWDHGRSTIVSILRCNGTDCRCVEYVSVPTTYRPWLSI